MERWSGSKGQGRGEQKGGGNFLGDIGLFYFLCVDVDNGGCSMPVFRVTLIWSGPFLEIRVLYDHERRKRLMLYCY